MEKKDYIDLIRIAEAILRMEEGVKILNRDLNRMVLWHMKKNLRMKLFHY